MKFLAAFLLSLFFALPSSADDAWHATSVATSSSYTAPAVLRAGQVAYFISSAAETDDSTVIFMACKSWSMQGYWEASSAWTGWLMAGADKATALTNAEKVLAETGDVILSDGATTGGIHNNPGQVWLWIDTVTASAGSGVFTAKVSCLGRTDS